MICEASRGSVYYYTTVHTFRIISALFMDCVLKKPPIQHPQAVPPSLLVPQRNRETFTTACNGAVAEVGGGSAQMPKT